MNTYINIPWRYQLSDAGAPDIVASSVSLSLLHDAERGTNVLPRTKPGKIGGERRGGRNKIIDDSDISEILSQIFER